MAGADVIEAAIGITLLIIVSYVVIGGIMTTADVTSNAQKDMTLLQEERLGTSILIEYADYHWVGKTVVDFRVENTGNEIIQDVSQINVILVQGSNAPNLYITGTGLVGTYTWKNNGLYIDTLSNSEIINIGQWDPGEYLYGRIDIISQPNQITVILPNGVEGISVVS